MGHVQVPWFIGGDAIASDRIARVVSFMAAGGRQGVLHALDCRVLALSTPGPGFQVMPGVYSINLQSHANENYVGMVDTPDNVSTTATGSSGGRSDLIVFMVKNPYDGQENWDIPPDPSNGPYVETVVITGVPAGTKTWSELGRLGTAIPIARIDFPPNTATVTQNMITDLRGGATNAAPGSAPVATPPADASQTVLRVYQGGATPVLFGPTNTTPIVWPGNAVFNIPVPPWATSFTFDIDIKGVRLTTGNVLGVTSLKIGNYGYSGPTVFDINYTGSLSTETLSCGGSYNLTPAMRGTVIPFSFMMQMQPGQSGTLGFGGGSYFRLWMFFQAGPALT